MTQDVWDQICLTTGFVVTTEVQQDEGNNSTWTAEEDCMDVMWLCRFVADSISLCVKSTYSVSNRLYCPIFNLVNDKSTLCTPSSCCGITMSHYTPRTCLESHISSFLFHGSIKWHPSAIVGLNDSWISSRCQSKLWSGLGLTTILLYLFRFWKMC